MFIHELFYCVGDLVDQILDSDYADSVAIACKYDTARYVIKELLTDSDIVPYAIELQNIIWDGYDKEFLITIKGNDLYCEYFYRNGSYLYWGDDVTFVLPDCSKECVDFIKKNVEPKQACFEVEFTCDGCDEEDDDEEESVEFIKDDDGNTIGLSVSSSEDFDDGTVTTTLSILTPDSDVLGVLAKALKIPII